jgi:hypothetical protein
MDLQQMRGPPLQLMKRRWAMGMRQMGSLRAVLARKLPPDRRGCADRYSATSACWDPTALPWMSTVRCACAQAMREALLAQLQEARERSVRLQSSLRSNRPPPPQADAAAYIDRKVRPLCAMIQLWHSNVRCES